MPNESYIDQEILLDLKEVMGDDYSLLISTYFQDAKKKLLSLDQAISLGISDEIRTLSHSLKGSSSNIGATSLTQLCSQMETMGRSGDLSSASSLLEQINHVFSQVQKEIVDDL